MTRSQRTSSCWRRVPTGAAAARCYFVSFPCGASMVARNSEKREMFPRHWCCRFLLLPHPRPVRGVQSPSRWNGWRPAARLAQAPGWRWAVCSEREGWGQALGDLHPEWRRHLDVEEKTENSNRLVYRARPFFVRYDLYLLTSIREYVWRWVDKGRCGRKQVKLNRLSNRYRIPGVHWIVTTSTSLLLSLCTNSHNRMNLVSKIIQLWQDANLAVFFIGIQTLYLYVKFFNTPTR